ncbi:MAG TPA: ATP-dependent DNA helicase RecG [Thermoanaerobaculia bacterium]|nr:ATP-dependent DNA helicase RecG [Thermoanaerobaculia bacterium]
MDLHTPLSNVRGIGPARVRALEKAGLRTVLDLVLWLPHRYEDRREVRPVASAAAGEAGTFRGTLSGMRRLRTRRRGFSLVRGVLRDESGEMPVVWFNQPYLAQQVVPGEEYVLHGQVRESREGTGIELVNPSCERARDEGIGRIGRIGLIGRIAPVYPAVSGARGLGPATLRRVMDTVLGGLDLPRQVADTFPPDLLERYGLPRLGEALFALHRPDAAGFSDVEALNRRRSPAHLRVIFGELLETQLALTLLRSREIAEAKPLRPRVDERLLAELRKLVPFPLTRAQERVLGEIAADLAGPRPMLRLLQGDVGSGKTAVAALALGVVLANGFQGAFMAPTELLAEQHFASLQRLLGDRWRLGLFTGTTGRSAEVGEVDLAVGTHALIQERVAFRRLGLAVVDEQHRFGVEQRAELRRKGKGTEGTDLLVMTATPIPRTLALTAWGDLEISTIDEMPPGRTPVATRVLPARQRPAVYTRVREELEAGGRAYVVAPLIEESGRVAVASLAEVEEHVRELLPGWPCALLHGRLPAPERERVMRSFAAGEIRVLVATTVIEVGVDVPEATCMVLESAERFGLAQLHQLRGRVGRGARPSLCFALYGKRTAEAKRRLEVFEETNDGFVIAEADLEIRGPGDVLGTRQAGLPQFRFARLPEDRDWLERARDDARGLLGRLEEPGLEGLREQTARWVRAALEDRSDRSDPSDRSDGWGSG